MILFIGLITSFEDIYFQRIKNWYVLLGIFGGLFIHGYLFYSGKLDTIFISYYVIDIIIAALLGFGLYWIDFWSAGDGKLLIAYICMLPIYLTINGSFLGIFTIFSVFINTFIPFMLFTGAKQVISNITDHETGFSKGSITESLISDIVFLLGISWISGLILIKCGLSEPNNLLIALISSIIMIITEKIKEIIRTFKKNSFFARKSLYPIIAERFEIVVGLGILIYRIFYDIESLLSVLKTFDFLVIYLLVNSVKKLVKGSANSLMKRKIKLGMIMPGMHLASNIYKSDNLLVLENNDKEKNKGKGVEKGVLVIPAGTVLTSEMVNEIERMKKLGKVKFDEFYIEYFMPFANLLFIGILLTLFTNFASVLLKI